MSDGEQPAELLNLPLAARAQLEVVIDLLGSDAAAPTTVTERPDAWKVHVADSLSGLVFGRLRDAGRICDIGAGAGFPGLALACALPGADVDLVESRGRKCEFMRRAIAAAGIENATVVEARAEEWAGGSGAGAYEAATARAVGRLSTLAELASPLLRPGGVLVAWKGRRDPEEEAELARAAEPLAMATEDVRWAGPYAGSRHRHLHLLAKTGPTPAGLPRRPGMAKKRPRGRG